MRQPRSTDTRSRTRTGRDRCLPECGRPTLDNVRKGDSARSALGARRGPWLTVVVLLLALLVVGLAVAFVGMRSGARWVDPTRARVRRGWGGACGLAARPDHREHRGICRPPNGGYYCYHARTSDVRLWSENPIRFDGDCKRAKTALIKAGIIPR